MAAIALPPEIFASTEFQNRTGYNAGVKKPLAVFEGPRRALVVVDVSARARAHSAARPMPACTLGRT